MTPFSRTYQQLLRERQLGTLAVIAGVALVFCGWLAWFVGARVAVYEVSSRARVEIDSASVVIASSLAGRVVATQLRLSQSVRRGDVLMELDSVSEQLELRAREERAHGLEEQRAQVRVQMDAERAARAKERQGARLEGRDVQALVREANVSAAAARKQTERLRALEQEGLSSAWELERSEAEAQLRAAALSRLQLATEQTPEKQALRELERDVRIERLRGELASLETELQVAAAERDRLGYEIERRRIRAPVDGRVGDAAKLHVGAVIAAGQRLGSIVTGGEYVVIAQYPAEAVFGRIRPGQAALLRLQGFPWSEFGTVSVNVARVAEEVQDGSVRVECALSQTSDFRGRLAHGMPGTLEVTVDQLSPLALVRGGAAQWLTARR